MLLSIREQKKSVIVGHMQVQFHFWFFHKIGWDRGHLPRVRPQKRQGCVHCPDPQSERQPLVFMNLSSTRSTCVRSEANKSWIHAVASGNWPETPAVQNQEFNQIFTAECRAVSPRRPSWVVSHSIPRTRFFQLRWVCQSAKHKFTLVIR